MKPVPESVTVNTGEQHLLTNTIDDFFTDTRARIEEEHGKGPYFEIKSGEIAFGGLLSGEVRQTSDNRVTYLLYKERVIALVMETRTEMNHVRYSFFRNLDANLKEDHT